MDMQEFKEIPLLLEELLRYFILSRRESLRMFIFLKIIVIAT